MPYPMPPLGYRPDTPLNPDRSYLLEFARVQKNFVRGEGCWLYDEQGRRYLDFIAQYGAVPFGYNPPALWEAVERCRREQTPMMVQPATSVTARELAERLSAVAPGQLKYVTFCCTGTETVEAAIKLARARTGRPGVVGLEGGFHGKTLGALSATGRKYFQTPFHTPLPGFYHVPFGDLEALRTLLERHGHEIGLFITEIVQGEGGMRALPAGFLAEAQRLCRKHGVLLAVDEVQTGLGRTGVLFACQSEGVEPDMLLLSKALGGGMVPLGAVLCTADVWTQQFGMLHSSTFANNALACRVGLAVLDQVMAPGFLDDVNRRSHRLLDGLRALQRKYPDILSRVTGRGLMLGLHLDTSCFTGDDSLVMSSLSREGTLGPFLAGHLINTWKLWVAPLISQDNALRLEPPLTIQDEEIDYALGAIDGMAGALHRRDIGAVMRFLTEDDEVKPDPARHFGPLYPPRPPAPPVVEGTRRRRFAFFVHYPELRELRLSEPSFKDLPDAWLNRFLKKIETYTRPTVAYHLPLLRSRTGQEAEGWLIALGLLPDPMLLMGKRRIDSLMLEGLQAARTLGADVFGLGAFTSVVTQGGQTLTGKGVPITSGNTYTVALAVEGVVQGCHELGLDLRQVHAAVVGAAGSIGRLASQVLAERVHRLTLVGNPVNMDRLASVRRVAGQIYRRALATRREGVSAQLWKELGPLFDSSNSMLPSAQEQARRALLAALEVPPGQDPDAAVAEAVEALYASLGAGRRPPIEYGFYPAEVLPHCEVVISASSSAESVIRAQDLRPGAVVCDVALPPDASTNARKARPDVLVFDGGLARYPEPELNVGFNFGYPPGMGMGCLSETMILALEADGRDHSIGRNISFEDYEYITRLAHKHGFGFSGLRSNGKDLGPEDFQRVKAAARAAQAPGGAPAAAPRPEPRRSIRRAPLNWKP